MTEFEIRGFIETSFLDWDGKISSVLFVPKCTFSCPFCHNKTLVKEPESLEPVPIEKIEDFIKERKDFIDGIVITGGEPTLYSWLPKLCKRFKALGLLVKLDTNGINPPMLSDLIGAKLIDFVAMDYKGPLDARYDKSIGTKTDLNKIKQSIKIILDSGIDHEFRITVVPTLHKKEDIVEMAKAIPKAKKLVLQQFVNKNTLDPEFEKIHPYEAEELKDFCQAAQQFVPNTILRGA